MRALQVERQTAGGKMRVAVQYSVRASTVAVRRCRRCAFARWRRARFAKLVAKEVGGSMRSWQCMETRGRCASGASRDRHPTSRSVSMSGEELVWCRIRRHVTRRNARHIGVTAFCRKMDERESIGRRRVLGVVERNHVHHRFEHPTADAARC